MTSGLLVVRPLAALCCILPVIQHRLTRIPRLGRAPLDGIRMHACAGAGKEHRGSFRDQLSEIIGFRPRSCPLRCLQTGPSNSCKAPSLLQAAAPCMNLALGANMAWRRSPNVLLTREGVAKIADVGLMQAQVLPGPCVAGLAC